LGATQTYTRYCICVEIKITIILSEIIKHLVDIMPLHLFIACF